MSDLMPPIPRQSAPELSVDLVGGGQWSLDGTPPAAFTLLVFYRGWHCPICRNQLRDMQSRLFDFERLGVEVIAISTDVEKRATSTKKDWGLDRLTIGYGLELKKAREWGLYISTHRGKTSIGVDEPAMFSEPGLFLVKPDRTLYYAAIQSAPFARPATGDIIKAIEFVLDNNYPARGEVVAL